MTSATLASRIRQHVVEMTSRGRSSHVASGLSIADIIGVLYGGVLRVRPEDPAWADRDRFILSKGHAGAAVYAALAETGFFPVAKLATHCQDGSDLSGHVSHKGVPGVELSTGSLGHGLSVACGIALSARLRQATFRTVVLMSDGECDEGSVWEAAMFGGHHRLSNLVAIIDYNKIQSLGSTDETLSLEPFATKWRAFGWEVVDVDGHNHEQLASALMAASTDAAPRCVLAHTTKGKGVSFMERSVLWHYRSPQGDELAAALTELAG
jgi:transketolase